jgi:hypothetical protein
MIKEGKKMDFKEWQKQIRKQTCFGSKGQVVSEEQELKDEKNPDISKRVIMTAPLLTSIQPS